MKNKIATTASNTFYQDNGWIAGMPWLYYQRSATEVLTQSKRVQLRVSFGYQNPKIGVLNKLTYKIGKFDLLGNFYGFETLSDQILICQTSSAGVERLMTFGVTIKD